MVRRRHGEVWAGELKLGKRRPSWDCAWVIVRDQVLHPVPLDQKGADWVHEDESPRQPSEPSMSRTEAAGAPLAAAGPRRILLVDDDEDIREVAQMSLEAVGGWHVSTARNGLEALDLAIAERPEAIVMDVMMPGMDGTTAAVALSQNPATAHIPIVLLTAKDQRRGPDLSELPVVGVLSKPFNPMLLPATLAEMLGWS